MKARTGEYRPKQTDYDIADGINRSFVKTDSSKFIKFINAMGLFVDYLENMTHFGETETLPIFRFLLICVCVDRFLDVIPFLYRFVNVSVI